MLDKGALVDGCRGGEILALCLDFFLHLVQSNSHVVGFGGVIFAFDLFQVYLSLERIAHNDVVAVAVIPDEKIYLFELTGRGSFDGVVQPDAHDVGEVV